MHCVYILLEEESQCHLLKMVKVDLIQDHHEWVQGPLQGDFTVGERLGTKHGHVGIHSQGAGWGQWMENYSEGTPEVRGFWLN